MNSFSVTKIEHLIIYRFNKSLNNFTYVIPVLEQVLTIYKFRAGVLRVHVLTILIYLINYVVFLVILPHDSFRRRFTLLFIAVSNSCYRQNLTVRRRSFAFLRSL